MRLSAPPASVTTTSILLLLAASNSVRAAAPAAGDLEAELDASLGSPESCPFPGAEANAVPCGSSNARSEGESSSSSSGRGTPAPKQAPVHLERSSESSKISLGKHDPHDPRSLRFQSSVFRSSTGRTGRSAYDLGIRPHQALVYERSPASEVAAQVQQYAPSPAAPHLAANAGKGARPGGDLTGSNGGDEAGSGKAKGAGAVVGQAGGEGRIGASATAHLPFSPSGAQTAPSAGVTNVPPLPFFPYSTSPMLSDADYRLPTFASKPRYRTNPPPNLLHDANPADTEVLRAKPRHKLMSKLAWNRLPSWSRVLLEDAVTLLNVPDAHGKVRRRSRSPFTGKWWRWAYGRGWIYGYSRDWSALESGRGPGVALAHLLPDRQVWTVTPPRMHWRVGFIASIAVPTFFLLILALLIIQWLFFPHTLDFSSPVGDGYVYLGLPSSGSGGWGPMLPFNHKRSRSRSPSGGSSSHGGHDGKVHMGKHGASMLGNAMGTGAEPGPSHLHLTRRSPNPFRGRSAHAVGTLSSSNSAASGWGDAAVELGLTRGGGGGEETLPLSSMKSGAKASPPMSRSTSSSGYLSGSSVPSSPVPLTVSGRSVSLLPWSHGHDANTSGGGVAPGSGVVGGSGASDVPGDEPLGMGRRRSAAPRAQALRSRSALGDATVVEWAS